ncbi:MAG TPA: LamG domain-containing protein, partial [Micromonosporaceae bacterium]|nr:LamG domain-containing protein [Micromonosporaceae bacterium]
AGGSFTVTATSTDTQSGIASYQYPNFGTGWSVPSTTNTNTYTWTVNPAVPTPAAQNVTATDNAGRVSAPASFSTVPDPTAPTGGSVSHLNGSTASRSITVTFTNGTDSGSGLNLTSRRLSRSAQPLVNGLCTGTITVLTISNVTSPYTDTTVTNGTCYWYQYAIADNVGNTAVWSSNSVAKVDYATAVNATTSLVGHWRLGEPAISSSDNFTDPAGTVLASHTSQTRTTWARRTGDAITAVITPSGKVRRNGLGNVTYYTSGVPTSADYLVEADLNYQTAIAGNFAGVVGRLDPASGNYYTAGYDGTSFRLRKSVGGVLTDIGTPYDQNLDFGFTYRFGLDMTGSTIRLVVDGKTGGSVVDTGITAAGRAGVHFSNATNAASDTTGMLLDELEVSHQARDEKGLNPGDYHRGPQLGAAGALTDNTAAQFDGANDSLLIPTETNIPKGAAPRTVETWFRTPGVALHQDRQVLFSYGQFATNVLFSAWIEPGGTQLTFGGGRAVANRTFTFPSNVNDNRWHHFAITYNGSALAMYVDGVAGTGGSSPIALNTLNSASGITVGRWTPNSKNLNDGYFNGALDELAIYNDAMTPTTVLEHYSFLQQGPVGGSVDVTGLTPERFATPTALTIALNKGTDADGVAPTGALLYRANGTLDSAGTCSGWTPYLLLDGPADAATKSDTIPNTSACYRYQYVVADNFGGQTTYLSGEIRVDTRPPETSQYDATVKATAGLAGYWRLGETLVFNDTFTDFQSTSLGAHKSDSGGSWTLRVADHIGASINSTGNLYHNNIGGTVYYTNPAPTTANYLVEADVIAKSATTTHIAGVVGRLDSAGTGDGTFYTARYNSTGTPRWELGKVVNGTSTALGTASAETLTIGRAYRLGLDMSGSTIRLLVDGVVRTSATDNDPSLTAAGRAGVRFASTTAFDVQTTGVQLDNFRVASGPLTDARNISHGVYRATGVTLGVPGALVGSRNTAVALNGSAGHGFIPANAALTVNSTFSVEAWVKRGTLGTTQTIMYKGPNGLWWRFDADNKLGLYTGSGQLIFKSNAILTDTTAFHHYVFTYTNVPSISVALYVDGVSVAGTAGAHTPPTDSGQAMYIGSKAALDYFNGTLDEVALYNTVMPLATVTNHYNKGRGN